MPQQSKKLKQLYCKIKQGGFGKKYQRNVVILKDMTEEEFVTKYQEIIDKQEFARNEIGRLEQSI